MDDRERGVFDEALSRAVAANALPARTELEAIGRATAATRALADATAVLTRAGVDAQDPLSLRVELERIFVELDLATARSDAAPLRGLLARIDRVLGELTQREAPLALLECRGLWIRARLLAPLGDVPGARAHLREVVDVLEEHQRAQAALGEMGREVSSLLDPREEVASLLRAAYHDQDELDASALPASPARATGRTGRGADILIGVGLIALALLAPLLYALAAFASGHLDGAGQWMGAIGWLRLGLGAMGAWMILVGRPRRAR